MPQIMTSALTSRPIAVAASFRPNLHATDQWHDLAEGAPPALGPQLTRKDDPKADTQAKTQILHELLNQASQSGYALTHVSLGQQDLSGGNTTETVGLIRMTAPFVFKIDASQMALADEAATIKAIRSDHRIGKVYRDAWPIIYGLRRKPPYAYLMEYFPRESGWQSLESRLYGDQDLGNVQALEMLGAVLEVMEEGIHTSVCRRHHPSVWETYLSRVEERMELSEQLDPWFHGGSQQILGSRVRGWRDCLTELRHREQDLQQLTPGFSTVAHGDPNPGNILLRQQPDDTWEVKLIDPKAWGTADYLFDLAKIAHYLVGTGPLDHLGATVTEEMGDRFEYQLARTSWQDSAMSLCWATAERIAIRHGDRHWKARFTLALASNLLGLPVNRLKKGRTQDAKILFCEGLRLLDKFVGKLSS
jgi:hypothetical protein